MIGMSERTMTILFLSVGAAVVLYILFKLYQMSKKAFAILLRGINRGSGVVDTGGLDVFFDVKRPWARSPDTGIRWLIDVVDTGGLSLFVRPKPDPHDTREAAR